MILLGLSGVKLYDYWRFFGGGWERRGSIQLQFEFSELNRNRDDDNY